MIDISFAAFTDAEDDIRETISNAAKAVLKHENVSASACVTVVCAEEIRRLNREFRNKDAVTDVLSFPAWDGSQFDTTDGFLGDIAICTERAKKQAEEYGHSFKRELAFLTVHGMLHILGYDHVKSEDEAIMFPLQEKILKEMGLGR